MAGVGTEAHTSITIGQRLRRRNALVAKVRALDDMLEEVFGKDTPIEWDLAEEEPEISLSLRVGESKTGQCTRHPLVSLLEDTSWLKTVVLNMKECLRTVQQYLREVKQLYESIQVWSSHGKPPYEVKEEATTIEEALVGEYEARKLLIRQKKKTVEVRPRGAWWVTTQGRVDLVADETEYQLILSKPEGGWLWLEERPKVALHPLTEELFLRLVKECMG